MTPKAIRPAPAKIASFFINATCALYENGLSP
jgi:hypothetical protein